MSKTKRMIHVFNEMVVKPGRDIDTAELHFIDGGVSATFFCAQQAHHAAHAINNHDRMADEIAELRDKHSKMSNEIAELCEALGAVNEIALLIASDIYEDSLLHDNVKLLMDIHK